MPPADQSYGRSAGVNDPFGNTWWITSVWTGTGIKWILGIFSDYCYTSEPEFMELRNYRNLNGIPANANRPQKSESAIDVADSPIISYPHSFLLSRLSVFTDFPDSL
jgi:hypothetical protein